MPEDCATNHTLLPAGCGPLAASSESSIIEQHVVPAFGCLTCALLLLSPMKAVQHARLRGNLGDLNPLPWVFFAVNGAMYTTYGLMLSPADWYLVGTSAAGFLCGGFYTSSALHLASDRTFRNLEVVIYNFVVAMLFVFCIASQLADLDSRLAVIGVAGSMVNAFMYGAPLSSIRLVLRERSSATIHLPLVLTAMANTLLWTTYGLSTNQPFIYVPIGIGACFNAMLLVLKMCFPTSHAKTALPDEQPLLCCEFQSLFNRTMAHTSGVWARAPSTGSVAIPEILAVDTNAPGSPTSTLSLPSESPQVSQRMGCCPVCLNEMVSDAYIQLSCAHILCVPCAAKCDSNGHKNCPVCRHPHILDPSELKLRRETWRTNYNRWRRGQVRGSVGEIADISSVAGPKGAERKGAKETSSRELITEQQSDRVRALNLESSLHRPRSGANAEADAEKAKQP
eukprot:CAMPEP_0115847650 /NCGR_PEP_ID=MMETSP0287-20121206/10494_1 /TAXON_ID=412157 /ORGANISM="Chrysochromulina rotalis, Strain UIO044" /LENGTH=452 /DNA_ID=CAMNT_0003301495 /DNA_START=63 /DNA_END=1422 /DNA_ORIENTATION=+